MKTSTRPVHLTQRIRMFNVRTDFPRVVGAEAGEADVLREDAQHLQAGMMNLLRVVFSSILKQSRFRATTIT